VVLDQALVKFDIPYLGHIAHSITAIEAYVAGGRDTFIKVTAIHVYTRASYLLPVRLCLIPPE